MQGLRPLIAALGLLLAVAAMAAMAGSAKAAEPPALVTLLEGEATVVIGARAFSPVVGARLPTGTLVETGAQTGLMRLEWPDGSVLDLGPATKVMLRPQAMTVRKPPLFYLLQGWVKQTQQATPGGHVSAAADVPPFKGVLVVHAEDGQTLLFAEAGGAQLQPRRGGPALSLDAGQAASFGANVQPQVLPRPPAGWLPKVPRAFRETIPPRAAVAGKGPEPTLVGRPPLNFGAVQPWLAAEAGLRRELVPRLAELLSDRGFRDAATAQLPQQPEWEPWLRPPPPPAPPRPTASTRAARTNNDTTPAQEAPR
jgi:hypothetical protein